MRSPTAGSPAWWPLGRDSTPGQRRIAECFALYVLNDFSLNNLMLKAVGNTPVNQNVIVPVKTSAQLAAMERSLEASTVPSFRQGIGLRTRTEALRHLLKQGVYGEQPPEKVLQGIEAGTRWTAASGLAGLSLGLWCPPQ